LNYEQKNKVEMQLKGSKIEEITQRFFENIWNYV